ncbi:VWA domain-containing protein [soil metagenome]
MLLFAELAFRGWFPTWLAAVLGLLAIVATALVYRREAGRLSVPTRIGLAALRGLALALIAFMLLRPSLLYDSTEKRNRAIALLVDDSESLKTRDPRLTFPDKYRVAIAFDKVPFDRPLPTNPSAGDIPGDTPEKPSRLEIAQALLTNPRLKLLENLSEVGPVQPSAFGLRRIGIDPKDKNWVQALKGDQPRTAMVDSAYDLLRRDDSELPAAIVLMTDGRENASERTLEDLARECQRRAVPLYTIGLGSSSFSQLQIREAGVPETLFVDDTVSIPVRYRVRGAKEGKVVITTKLNGKEVATKTVDLKEGDDLREVLSFVPNKEQSGAGRQELTTTVQVLSGAETLTDTLAKTVRVVDQKIKVLMVDHAPRWDFKFLQRALLRDRRVEATFFLFDGDPRAMKSGPPFLTAFPQTRPELFAFDLLVLGDIAAANLNRDQQEMVRDFVAEGGGFVHIAGRNRGPASFVGTPLADVLPVEIEPVKFVTDAAARPQPFRPELTPNGVRSPMLSLDDDPVENLRIWQTLPEIYWSYPVRKLKPAADSYLVHPRDKTVDGKPMPLVAAHYYGKGYSVFIGFDETWRWRYNEADTYFARFWSQAVYVAGVPRTLGTKLTQLSLDTPDPLLGRTGTLYARLYTPDLRPATAERLTGRLEKLDAAAGDSDKTSLIELRALPGQPGEYIASVPFDRVGRFALKVDNGADSASLEYRVNLPPDHELAPGGLAEEELRKLAEATGGKFYQEETVHQLAKDLKPQTVVITRREEVLLWNRWMLLAVIGLLSAEWILRKFHSLS